jgi:hypothetical protein
VSLADARKARDAAREKASAGDDPAAIKRRERVARKLAAGTTFGAVALEYIEKEEREGRSPATIVKLRWARNWLLPAIGHRPVDQIEPHELLALLRRQANAGKLETARRTRALASRVFRYAVATVRAKSDRRCCAAQSLRLSRSTLPRLSIRSAWGSCCAPLKPIQQGAPNEACAGIVAARVCSARRASQGSMERDRF